MRLLRLLLAMVLAAASVAALARAQSAAPGGSLLGAEASGLRISGLELHPGATVEVGYDSNYFRRSGAVVEAEGESIAADAPIVDAWRLRVTPSLGLVSPGPPPANAEGFAVPPKLVLRASTFAAYSELLSAGAPVDPGEQRRLDLGIGANLDIHPERVWGADVGIDYLRISEPSGSDDPVLGWERESASFDAGVSWRPLGGMLRWRLGYQFRYNWYQRTFKELNNFEQSIDTRGSLRFLPRTAFLYEGQYAFIRYQYLSTDQNHGDSIRSRLGINTLFSNRVSVLAAAGWAASFHQYVGNAALHNYDGPILTLESKYFLRPQPELKPGDATVGLSSVSAGFVHEYRLSYLGDYYGRTRGYAGLDYNAGGRVLVAAQVGVSRIAYPPFVLRAEQVELKPEARYDARLSGEYRIMRMVAAIASFRYDVTATDNVVVVAAEPESGDQRPFADDLGYARFQLWVGGRWFM